MNYQIIAQQGRYRFLLAEKSSPKLGRILDLSTKTFYKPFNLQSILARGYWEEYKGRQHIINTLLSKVKEEKTVNNTNIKSILSFIAKELVAIEFSTKEEYEKYLELHPKADPKNHSIKTQKPETKKENNQTGIFAKIKPIQEHVDSVRAEQKECLSKFPKKVQLKKLKQIREYFDTFKDRPVAVRVPSSLLKTILNDKRLKNQHETGDSYGGFYDPGYRKRVENNFFSISKDSSPQEGPIYGYLYNERYPTAAYYYGDAVIFLKPDVKDRTTFTFGDSLCYDTSVAPSPLKNPSIESIPFASDFFQKEKEELDEDKAFYTECQFHGGIILDNIDYISSNRIDEETKDQLQRIGIKVETRQVNL